MGASISPDSDPLLPSPFFVVNPVQCWLLSRSNNFLDRLVEDHGSIDLEWLRNVAPGKAKEYLLSIYGLGLKSVECIRLLALSQIAFPVDTNVGRVSVRLGWVPLEPQPESVLIHQLEQYPFVNAIQKYLWPRLCKLDQQTLYELHYQMITFGKVFCRKKRPNCNACPMRGDCKHFASAYASAKLSLPRPEEKLSEESTLPLDIEDNYDSVYGSAPLPTLYRRQYPHSGTAFNIGEPIIEEPASPEPECIETVENAADDASYEYPDEIPTIKLSIQDFRQNLHDLMHAYDSGVHDGGMSKSIVAIASEAASIPMPKIRNVSRLRTEYQAYQLPDSHPLLEGMDRREPDDPCPYLLIIWTPGETMQTTEESCRKSQDMSGISDSKTCDACNDVPEVGAQTISGTILIPCRTATRGSFPLNGTYFQVNEVFADHDSSCRPIAVPRKSIWDLKRRTVYVGISTQAIFKGLPIESIQRCFWGGFICVRGFDRQNRAPKPLHKRLHFTGRTTSGEE